MERYKFRATDQFTDDFIYAPAFFIDRDNNQGYLAWGISDHHCVKKETVGQYTGLKDSNGIEIYEGDIINTCTGWRCVVVFKDGGFCYERIDRHGFIDYIFFGGHSHLDTVLNCKIIGNIHQNPELLEQK